MLPVGIQRQRIGDLHHVQHHPRVGRVPRVAVAGPAARAGVHLDVAAHQHAICLGQYRAQKIRARPAPAAAREDHPQVAATTVDQPVRGVPPLLPGVG